MSRGCGEIALPGMAVPDSNGESPAIAPQPPQQDAGPLDYVVRPFRRTGRYYARSWRDYFDRQRDELPVARPTLALAAQAFRDEIVLTGFRVFRPLGDTAVFERVNREVRAALEFYGQLGYLDNPERFFTTPPPLTDVTIRPAKTAGRSYERLTFDSEYQPQPGEPGRERWLGYTANNREYALVLRHPEPRPWLVCVHGAVMGRGLLDLTLFRAWHLHENLGLNVVLPVLPMHGPRAQGLPRGAVFPGEDVLDDVHATAQAVWDVRRLLSWIRAQEPDSPIGLNSISLGGYITSLVASLEDGLTCAILGVPVADMTRLLGRHSGLSRTDPRRDTLALAEPLGQMVSPLSLTPRVPMRGRFVYAGVADQVVHPREQVVRLWEHWGRPEIVWYKGGHTGFFESRPVQRFVDAALVQSGLVDS
ncbi:alpha/beta hydrolase [soil metagenome]